MIRVNLFKLNSTFKHFGSCQTIFLVSFPQHAQCNQQYISIGYPKPHINYLNIPRTLISIGGSDNKKKFPSAPKDCHWVQLSIPQGVQGCHQGPLWFHMVFLMFFKGPIGCFGLIGIYSFFLVVLETERVFILVTLI